MNVLVERLQDEPGDLAMVERITPENVLCKDCRTTRRISNSRHMHKSIVGWIQCDDLRWLCPECITLRLQKSVDDFVFDPDHE